MNIIQNLETSGLIKPPTWLSTNIHYAVIMGSYAYGVSNDLSDTDVYGWCIPPKKVVFPHLAGEILGFGRQIKRFEVYQQHHVNYKDRSYDLSIYNIVKYFHLVMMGNPNMIDSLFVPTECILTCTSIGNLVRENRKLFLSKKCWHTFKGYAYSELSKIDNKEKVGKRKEEIKNYGYSIKYAYHLVRLLNEIEMILSECDLDLRRNNEQLKSIRRGEWTQEQVSTYFSRKKLALEELYNKSTLCYEPDEQAIKQLLLNCLESHYGSLENCINVTSKFEDFYNKVHKLVVDYQ